MQRRRAETRAEAEANAEAESNAEANSNAEAKWNADAEATTEQNRQSFVQRERKDASRNSLESALLYTVGACKCGW